ncbi:MAG: hypothetical protein JWQ04_645 [Pedosphaera sp.]|nr:hypothetical protein [Pedosphaera sp.]
MKMSDSRFLRLGIQWGPRIGFRCTLTELGRDIGCSKQLAFYHSNVALGKVIYRLRESMKQNKHQLYE